MRRALLACALLALAAPAQSGPAQRRETVARTMCAGCHAIGRTGESPLAVALPFRTLHTRYPVESLTEALAEGIVTGDPTMPEFALDAAQVNSFVAYLKSPEPRRGPRRS